MNLSEIFYSLQGEGPTRGTPSIFIRLVGCNLTCGIQSPICDASKAEWICDSYKVWKTLSEELTNEQLLERILSFVSIEDLITGKVHIIWTGGEPTLPKNAADIISFYQFLKIKNFQLYNCLISEIETNGTILNETLFNEITYINCSPKLSNSGIRKDERINVDFLKQKHPVFYKFVVTKKEHWNEIEEDFLPYINRSSIILMPGMDHLGEDSMKVCQEIWNLAMEKRVGFSTREHISVWNKLTGV